MSLPDDVIARLRAIGVNSDRAVREWRKMWDQFGVPIFMEKLAREEEFAQVAREIHSLVRDHACRRPLLEATPTPAEQAQAAILREAMARFAESPEADVILGRRCVLPIITTSPLGLPAAAELFASASAVVFTPEEIEALRRDVLTRRLDFLPGGFSFRQVVTSASWILTPAPPDFIPDEALLDHAPTTSGEFWLLEYTAEWEKSKQGGQIDVWHWDGSQATACGTMRHPSLRSVAMALSGSYRWPADTNGPVSLPKEARERLAKLGVTSEAGLAAWGRDYAEVSEGYFWRRLEEVESRCALYLRHAPAMRAFAAERRHSTPTLDPATFTPIERAKYEILRGTMVRFGAEKGRTCIIGRRRCVPILRTTRLGLPAAIELFGHTDAVVLLFEEKWPPELQAALDERDEMEWWTAHASWNLEPAPADFQPGEWTIEEYGPKSGGEFWFVTRSVMWGPLSGGQDQDVWHWDGTVATEYGFGPDCYTC